MATRMEVVQLESRMDSVDYRKLQGLFTVGSRLSKREEELQTTPVLQRSRVSHDF